MTHGILSTLSIAAFGFFAARAGDLFRAKIFRAKPCDESSTGGGAWTFDGDAAQQQGAWMKVRRQGAC